MLESVATTGNKVNLKGKVRVLKQDEDTYLAIIPVLSIDRHDGTNILFPPFRADVSVETKPGATGGDFTSAYHLAVRLPKNIRLKAKGSDKDFPLEFDQKRFNLTWQLEHFTFSSVDVEIADLRVVDPWGNITVTADHIINTVSLKESSPGIFSGSSKFKILERGCTR